MKTVLIIGIVAGLIALSFFAGSSYQASVTPNLPVTTPAPLANISTITDIESSYVNVTILVSSKAIAPAVGTLHFSLSGITPWSDARPYTIKPGDHQAFQFFPPSQLSSYTGVIVQP